jgi:spore maturation protein SpmA
MLAEKNITDGPTLILYFTINVQSFIIIPVCISALRESNTEEITLFLNILLIKRASECHGLERVQSRFNLNNNNKYQQISCVGLNKRVAM